MKIKEYKVPIKDKNLEEVSDKRCMWKTSSEV